MFYSPALNQWMWAAGPGHAFGRAVYGTVGVESSTSTPGGIRQSAFYYVEEDGLLYIFGGWGHNHVSHGFVDDVWSFNVTSLQWMFLGGSFTANAIPTYGTLGQESRETMPGGNFQGNMIYDKLSQSLYTFGGHGPSLTTAEGICYVALLHLSHSFSLHGLYMAIQFDQSSMDLASR